MSINQTIWSDVAIGVIVTLIIVGFRYQLGRLASLINPHGVSGTWKITFWKREKTFHETATVYQFLHWVWGTINYPNKPRTYKFSGTLRGNILVATYEVTGQPSVIDRGAFTLALNNTGEVLAGRYSWTDDETPIPAGDEYEWKKY